MQEQPIKTATRIILAKQTPTIRIKQPMEEERPYLQRNQEENNQATISIPDTQERHDATSKGPQFFISSPQSNQLKRVNISQNN